MKKLLLCILALTLAFPSSMAAFADEREDYLGAVQVPAVIEVDASGWNTSVAVSPRDVIGIRSTLTMNPVQERFDQEWQTAVDVATAYKMPDPQGFVDSGIVTGTFVITLNVPESIDLSAIVPHTAADGTAESGPADMVGFTGPCAQIFTEVEPRSFVSNGDGTATFTMKVGVKEDDPATADVNEGVTVADLKSNGYFAGDMQFTIENVTAPESSGAYSLVGQMSGNVKIEVPASIEYPTVSQNIDFVAMQAGKTDISASLRVRRRSSDSSGPSYRPGGSSGFKIPPVVSSTGDRYTADIFGNVYETHTGYINGYPDGSVQPNGNITRDEMAAIIYRIKAWSTQVPTSGSGNVFPDVPATRWSVTEVEYVANTNVMNGYPDGTFLPDQNLTRAEFAALISRFTQLDAVLADETLADVPSNHWAYTDIHALYSSGLLEGDGDGRFRPEDAITRAEVMTVINKILGRNPSDAYVRSLNNNPFNDLSSNQWYYTVVLEATLNHDYTLDSDGLEIEWSNTSKNDF